MAVFLRKRCRRSCVVTVLLGRSCRLSRGEDVDVKKLENKKNSSLFGILKRIHQNERGAVSIETILIIAAIALPILIFIIKFGWPRVKDFFNKGMDDLEDTADDAVKGP